MPVLQTTIRDCRLKSLDVTYSQRSQQREMHERFITPGCRTGAGKRTPVRHIGCHDRSRELESRLFIALSMCDTGL